MASVRERTTNTAGTTYQVLYRHGRKQTSRTFVTQEAAQDFARLVDILGPDKALKASGINDQPAGITVSELAQRFLAWKERDVTSRTLGDYRRDVTNWIEPWFGHRSAEDVDESDVQQWVDHMATQLSPKSVTDRHMLLHSMYNFGKAKTRRLVSHNPCSETELPKRVKKPPKGTTVPEFREILRAALEVKKNPDAHDLVLFLGETGWRFSEATALDVRDVEDDGVDVWVTVSQVFRLDDRGRQSLAEGQAKSYRAFRRIRLFPESAAMVRRRVVGKAPGQLVFTNRRGNHWNQNTFLRDTWPGIVAAAGLGDRRPTPHWLRHMHVAVLGASGAELQEIQRRIGHDSIATTIGVYGGMVGDISDDALERARAIMSGERSAPGVAPAVRGEVIQAATLELK